MNKLWMLTNEAMCERIDHAKDRVVYVAPGLWLDVAKALVGFVKNNGPGKLAIILDESPHICRLGYGEIKAVEILLENGLEVRKCTGLRAGIFIADEEAWFFSPTPLLVEEGADKKKEFAPNAVTIDVEHADKLVSSLSPKLAINDLLEKASETCGKSITVVPEPEIPYKEFTQKDLQSAKNDLDICPPQKFDLTRQVLVYSSYVQFVELKKILAPVVKKNPPDELRLGINTKKPTKEQVDRYLDEKLDSVIPDAESFVIDMKLHCVFKDVTYESLNDKDFIAALHKAYPYMEWPKLPYDHYKAAPEQLSLFNRD